MVIFIVLIVSVLLVCLISVILHFDNCYCNSSYNRCENSSAVELDKPIYEVRKIEEVYCKNNIAKVAKYTLYNFYIKKKNDVGMQTLIVYDTIGKYNVGDKLCFIVYNN